MCVYPLKNTFLTYSTKTTSVSFLLRYYHEDYCHIWPLDQAEPRGGGAGWLGRATGGIAAARALVSHARRAGSPSPGNAEIQTTLMAVNLS